MDSFSRRLIRSAKKVAFRARKRGIRRRPEVKLQILRNQLPESTNLSSALKVQERPLTPFR